MPTMTREDVMRLEGPALNAAIAEKVLGWSRIKDSNGSVFLISPTDLALDYFQRKFRAGELKPCDSKGDDINAPEFSTSRDACRLAEMEIEKRGLLGNYSALLWDLTREQWKRSDFAFIMADPADRCKAMLLAILGAE